jgi:hypothetical protein
MKYSVEPIRNSVVILFLIILLMCISLFVLKLPAWGDLCTSVSIKTGYGLDDKCSIPGAYSMGTWDSFPGSKVTGV